MSASRAPVELVFLWHHHQPDYRSPRERRSLLPWVRLHATKDYLDMALLLERHPSVRASFNFVPSLLDQLDEAAAGGRDALFDLLARDPADLSEDETREVRRRCAMVPPHARERWPDLAARCLSAGATNRALSARELIALQVGFLLAWLDPMFLSQPEALAVLGRSGSWDASDRTRLLELHARLLTEVVPAYRRLCERGQIELSASPYYHPILPLLVDPRSALRSRPDLPVAAEAAAAPEDAREQLRRALDRHARAFGAPPAGVWPSEGSVSPEVAELAAECGVRWLASDEGVLWRSLGAHAARSALYQPWRVATPRGDVAMLFRDRELSDRIGFVYHHWRAEEAVADLLGRVRRIGREWNGKRAPVVSIMLDGENCWEQYTGDGGPFLEALYRALESATDIVTRTPSGVLAEHGELETLGALHSGSWIDADFHIWMGHAEKNRAWDLLGRTRRRLRELAPVPSDAPRAWEHLFAAEGSDWFWWYGDDHWTGDRALFDQLFREHLLGVFDALGESAPRWLHVPVAALAERSDQVPPIGFVTPVVDGRRTEFYEWHTAGRARPGAGGSMHRDRRRMLEAFYGFDELRFVLRVDLAPGERSERAALAIAIAAPRPIRLVVGPLSQSRPAVERRDDEGAGHPMAGAIAAFEHVLELSVPFEALGLAAGERVEFALEWLEDGAPVESLPAHDLIRFSVPDRGWQDGMWSV